METAEEQQKPDRTMKIFAAIVAVAVGIVLHGAADMLIDKTTSKVKSRINHEESTN